MAKREITIGQPQPVKAGRDLLPSLEDDAQELLRRVQATVVRTSADAAAATTLARDIRAMRNRWNQHEKPVVDAAYHSYVTARDKYNALEKPLKTAEDRLKSMVGSFTLAARKATEIAAKATSAAAVSQTEAALGAHQETLQEAAETALQARATEIAEAEAVGDTERAERLRQEPVDIPYTPEPGLPPILLAPGSLEQAVQPNGMSVGEDWDFEIVDPNQVPDDYWSVDPKKVKATVAILKGGTRIPGVRVFAKPRVSMR